MPQEIERKFLVANDDWRGGADRGRRLRQAYLAQTDRVSIRVRIEDTASAVVTIKSANPGLSRQEFEYSVPLADAEKLTELRQGGLLAKTRFSVRHAARQWVVDVYSGDNEGLVLAEIELKSEAEEIEFPPWLGAEVTGDPRYYAAKLAELPYSSWRRPGEKSQVSR